MRQFSETVVYFPGGANRKARHIQAHVVRNNMQTMAEDGLILIQSIEVTVLNDSAEGISANEIDTGLDRISLSLGADGDRTLRSIQQILDDSNGMLRFTVS